MLNHYYFNLICILTILSYTVSSFLVKKNKLTLIAHRRLWNYLLLISFLISGLLGLLLAFLIDYKLSIAWYAEFLWFHVEFGIIMAIISIIHIIWHWRYFCKKR